MSNVKQFFWIITKRSRVDFYSKMWINQWNLNWRGAISQGNANIGKMSILLNLISRQCRSHQSPTDWIHLYSIKDTMVFESQKSLSVQWNCNDFAKYPCEEIQKINDLKIFSSYWIQDTSPHFALFEPKCDGWAVFHKKKLWSCLSWGIVTA